MSTNTKEGRTWFTSVWFNNRTSIGFWNLGNDKNVFSVFYNFIYVKVICVCLYIYTIHIHQTTFLDITPIFISCNITQTHSTIIPLSSNFSFSLLRYRLTISLKFTYYHVPFNNITKSRWPIFIVINEFYIFNCSIMLSVENVGEFWILLFRLTRFPCVFITLLVM